MIQGDGHAAAGPEAGLPEVGPGGTPADSAEAAGAEGAAAESPLAEHGTMMGQVDSSGMPLSPEGMCELAALAGVAKRASALLAEGRPPRLGDLQAFQHENHHHMLWCDEMMYA